MRGPLNRGHLKIPMILYVCLSFVSTWGDWQSRPQVENFLRFFRAEVRSLPSGGRHTYQTEWLRGFIGLSRECRSKGIGRQGIVLKHGGKIDSIHHHLQDASSETANVLELKQKLLYTTPARWCTKSLFRHGNCLQKEPVPCRPMPFLVQLQLSLEAASRKAAASLTRPRWLRSVLIIAIHTFWNRGSQIPESLFIFKSTCPLKV